MQNIISTDPTYIFTVQHNRTLTAIFEADVQTYTITAAIDPAGSGTVTGAGQYQEGAQATITAVPAEGYAFTAWQEGGVTVSNSISHTFTVTGDRTFVAAFEEVQQSRLPAGYIEIEYIQSDETQLIDTGFKPTSTLKLSMDVEPLDSATSSDKFFFDSSYFQISGGKVTNRYTVRAIWVNTGVNASMGLGKTVTYKVISKDTTPRRMILEMDIYNKIAKVDNEESTFSSNAISSSMGSITLLAYTTRYRLSAKLYSCQIYSGGTVVRDFVPCISPDGTPGLYDIANEKFYQSATTEMFTAGPAV